MSKLEDFRRIEAENQKTVFPDKHRAELMAFIERQNEALATAFFALEHYQYVEDEVVKFTKGFAAKPGDIDPNGRARYAITAINAILNREWKSK